MYAKKVGLENNMPNQGSCIPPSQSERSLQFPDAVVEALVLPQGPGRLRAKCQYISCRIL
jgi:hypothetical protein